MTEAIVDAWEALSRGGWSEALSLLEGADGDPEALEAAAVAHWWLDDADATIAACEQAYRIYRERGDNAGAARVAGSLAWDAILFGGRRAVARGWIERGHRLLEDEPVGPEHAWLAVREAEVALASGAPAAGRAAAERAIAIGGHVGREDVQVVGRSLQGLCLVHEGLVEEGMRRLDESAVAAKGGDLRDLMWVGKVCCNLISACERVGDAERAAQWCAEVKEFAQRWELRTLFNVCRTQYAAVLVQAGAWEEAEAELQAALAVFDGGRRSPLAEGTARLGELRRRQGRLDEARTLFARSEQSWTARLGTVELALDAGDPETALALVERLERATEAERHLDRIAVLALLVRAAVAAGKLDTASRASAELELLAGEVGTRLAQATASRAAGECALAAGDLDLARRRLEQAVDLFTLCATPYERARAGLALAGALLQGGARGPALAEATAARDAFLQLDARCELAAAERLIDRASPRTEGAGPLTRREREVLTMVAEGHSNREIGSRLVVSEHTVHRHVANILRKLGEPTRAAAVARAGRDGLI